MPKSKKILNNFTFKITRAPESLLEQAKQSSDLSSVVPFSFLIFTWLLLVFILTKHTSFH